MTKAKKKAAVRSDWVGRPFSKGSKLKLPKIKSESANFQRALSSGTLPKNATTQALAKFFGAKGKPLKRQLRSKKQIEEYNRLLTKYNRERPTKAKEEQKRKAIREKQLSTYQRNVSKKRAQKATADYNKLLDIMESVKDDIGSYISYAEARMMIEEAPDITPDDIVNFIKSHWQQMQDGLPDFAKQEQSKSDTAALDNMFNQMREVMHDFNTFDMDKVSEYFALKNTNPARYARLLKQAKAGSRARRKSKRL